MNKRHFEVLKRKIVNQHISPGDSGTHQPRHSLDIVRDHLMGATAQLLNPLDDDGFLATNRDLGPHFTQQRNQVPDFRPQVRVPDARRPLGQSPAQDRVFCGAG